MKAFVQQHIRIRLRTNYCIFMLISGGRVSISAEEGDENKARDDAGDDAE